MNLTQVLNRSFNLLGVTLVALAGLVFTPEAILESGILAKADDLILIAIGGIAVVWYQLGDNRFNPSVTPVILILIALSTKIAGLTIELNDTDITTDLGGLILLTLAAAVIVYQYFATRKLLNDSNDKTR